MSCAQLHFLGFLMGSAPILPSFHSGFYNDLVTYMTSGNVVGLALRKVDAIKVSPRVLFVFLVFCSPCFDAFSSRHVLRKFLTGVSWCTDGD
jgi:hypothetical protein